MDVLRLRNFVNLGGRLAQHGLTAKLKPDIIKPDRKPGVDRCLHNIFPECCCATDA